MRLVVSILALLFAAPAFAEDEVVAARAPLAGLVGEWSVTTEDFIAGEGWRQGEAPTAARVEPLLGGAALQEYAQIRGPVYQLDLMTVFSWDRFREVYRIAVTDQDGMMDVYEGRAEGARLVVDNLRSDTSYVYPGGEMHFRLTYELAELPERWDFLVEISTDAGESWAPASRSTYRREG